MLSNGITLRVYDIVQNKNIFIAFRIKCENTYFDNHPLFFNEKFHVTRAEVCFTKNEIEYLSGMQCRSNGNGKFAFSCDNPKSFLRFLVFCNACEYIFTHRFSTSSGTYRLSNQAILRKTIYCLGNNTPR